MNCVICQKALSNRQKKFCSLRCKNKGCYDKLKIRNYQRERGRKKKRELIKLKGGKCSKCGYCKCLAVLSFHHKNPAEKLFPMSMDSISDRQWGDVLKEADKCDLVCLNCHSEIHNPEPL